MTELQLQAFLAMVTPRVIQWLKSKNFLVSWQGGSVNRVFSWIVGALFGLGIAFKYDPDVGSLLITGLTLNTLTHGLAHMIFQIVAHDFVYKSVVAPPQPGIEQAIQRQTGVIPQPMLAKPIQSDGGK